MWVNIEEGVAGQIETGSGEWIPFAWAESVLVKLNGSDGEFVYALNGGVRFPMSSVTVTGV